MKKSKPMPKKVKGTTTAEDHRKLADKHRARSQLHEAKANMLDIDEPPTPKGRAKGKVTVRPY